jgi:hypothetical protein
MTACSDFIAFQDSDDFSTAHRLACLMHAAIDRRLDIVGSHELRLDEISREVLPMRYPLDVTAALSDRAGHPQLFPTTIVRTSHFRNVGGFSTIRTFGSDTEYLLRSHFSSQVGNVDEFLYIRRRRAASLTTSPLTALDAPGRLRLDSRWKHDFAEIKRGAMVLAQSSLRIRHAARQFMIEDLASGHATRSVLSPVGRQAI